MSSSTDLSKLRSSLTLNSAPSVSVTFCVFLVGVTTLTILSSLPLSSVEILHGLLFFLRHESPRLGKEATTTVGWNILFRTVVRDVALQFVVSSILRVTFSVFSFQLPKCCDVVNQALYLFRRCSSSDASSPKGLYLTCGILHDIESFVLPVELPFDHVNAILKVTEACIARRPKSRNHHSDNCW